MLWILDLANCLFLDYYFFFRDFSLALLIQSSSPAFWFCLTFSASRHLAETVTYYSQEGVFSCGNILIQTAHAQWHGGRGAEFGMNATCLFVGGLLAAITLVGGLAWRWRCLSWSWIWGGTFHLLSCCHCLIRGRSWSHVTRAEALKVRSKLALFPFKCVFSPLPTLLGPPTPELWSKWGLSELLACVSHRQRSRLSLVSCLCRHLQLCPSLCSDTAWVQVPFIPHSAHGPLPLQPYWEASSYDRWGLQRLPACLRRWAVVEQPPSEIWAPEELLD